MNIILFEEHETAHPLSRRDARAVHLVKVLRKKPGDQFDAGIIGGMTGKGKIESVAQDGAIMFSLNVFEPPPPRANIRVGAGWVRPIQMRRILRDLSSMGAGAIDIFSTELGEKSYRDTGLIKDGGARAALVEGAAQSRDTILPELNVFPSLDVWLSARPWEYGAAGDGNAGDGNAGDGNAPLLVAADNVRPQGSFSQLPLRECAAVLALGSERGFSGAERENLEKAGFARLSLGPRALRTETACIAALALLLEKTGTPF